MRPVEITLLLVSLLILTNCSKQKQLTNEEGFVEVTGGKIWYRITGQGNKTPILMLHGGPGLPSYYFNPLRNIGKERKLITFDQLGCGRSDRISDTTLMTIDNYINQVKTLIDHLDIKEFYLYGHSWGTMLGMDYYLKYPEGIKGLILASPCLSSKLWETDADRLISDLPDSTQKVLRNDISGIKQDSSTLMNAIYEYAFTYYYRKKPISADIDSCASQMGSNVYKYMWGESEYLVTGTLKSYDRIDNLKDIKIPCLFIAGEFDSATPVTVKYYQSLTPNAQFKIIKNAGHMTMHDNPEEDIKAISEFLNELAH